MLDDLERTLSANVDSLDFFLSLVPELLFNVVLESWWAVDNGLGVSLLPFNCDVLLLDLVLRPDGIGKEPDDELDDFIDMLLLLFRCSASHLLFAAINCSLNSLVLSLANLQRDKELITVLPA